MADALGQCPPSQFPSLLLAQCWLARDDEPEELEVMPLLAGFMLHLLLVVFVISGRGFLRTLFTLLQQRWDKRDTSTAIAQADEQLQRHLEEERKRREEARQQRQREATALAGTARGISLGADDPVSRRIGAVALEEAFSFLTSNELAGVSRVCKSWRESSHRLHLWDALCVSELKMPARKDPSELMRSRETFILQLKLMREQLSFYRGELRRLQAEASSLNSSRLAKRALVLVALLALLVQLGLHLSGLGSLIRESLGVLRDRTQFAVGIVQELCLIYALGSVVLRAAGWRETFQRLALVAGVLELLQWLLVPSRPPARFLFTQVLTWEGLERVLVAGTPETLPATIIKDSLTGFSSVTLLAGHALLAIAFLIGCHIGASGEAQHVDFSLCVPAVATLETLLRHLVGRRVFAAPAPCLLLFKLCLPYIALSSASTWR